MCALYCPEIIQAGAVKGLRPEPGSTFSFTKLLSFEANTPLLLLYVHGDRRDY